MYTDYNSFRNTIGITLQSTIYEPIRTAKLQSHSKTSIVTYHIAITATINSANLATFDATFN
jgi:hypothetical protein